MSDSFDLQRFVDVQAAIYPRIVEELLRDENRHTECGSLCRRSPVSASKPWLNEAVAYLEYGLLGPRLVECTRLVTAASEKTITDILGSPDELKFRSCTTLFDAISKQ